MLDDVKMFLQNLFHHNLHSKTGRGNFGRSLTWSLSGEIFRRCSACALAAVIKAVTQAWPRNLRKTWALGVHPLRKCRIYSHCSPKIKESLEAYSHCCTKMLWSLLPHHRKMTVSVINRVLSEWLQRQTSDQQKLQQRHQRHIWRQLYWKDLLQHIQQPGGALPCHALPTQPFQLSQLCGNISVGMGQGLDDLTGQCRRTLWSAFLSRERWSFCLNGDLLKGYWLLLVDVFPAINIKIWQLRLSPTSSETSFMRSLVNPWSQSKLLTVDDLNGRNQRLRAKKHRRATKQWPTITLISYHVASAHHHCPRKYMMTSLLITP